MHDDELSIDDTLVRALLARDAPRFATLELQRLAASGSSNVLFRLGPDLLVRFPRQPGGSNGIETETRWVAALRPMLSVMTPRTVLVGEPGFGYPERWSISRWIEGRTPEPDGSATDELARDLARFVKELHGAEIPAAAVNDSNLHWYRSDPLSGIDGEVRRSIDECAVIPGLTIDLTACRRMWAEAVALPTSAYSSWIHSDLLGENILTRDGRLAAVLDFGALALGDGSVDLMVAWELFRPGPREVFRRELAVDDTTWQLGRGWALAVAVLTFPYYWHSMPRRCAARLAMLNQVVAEDTAG